MNILGQLAVFFPARSYRRVALAEIQAAGLSLEPGELWAEVQRGFQATPPPDSAQGAGVRLLIQYVRWNLALYRCLLAHGIDRELALQLIERIQWRIIEPATEGAFGLSRLRGASLAERVRWTVDMSFKLLFTRPFRREVLPSDRGAVFNVTYCPFAAYLKAEGAPELTGAALCSLDHHMARQWGVNFHRSQTIAKGSDHCDFEFAVPIESIGRAKKPSEE